MPVKGSIFIYTLLTLYILWGMCKYIIGLIYTFVFAYCMYICIYTWGWLFVKYFREPAGGVGGAD